jgi:hypothetical protein
MTGARGAAMLEMKNIAAVDFVLPTDAIAELDAIGTQSPTPART